MGTVGIYIHYILYSLVLILYLKCGVVLGGGQARIQGGVEPAYTPPMAEGEKKKKKKKGGGGEGTGVHKGSRRTAP